MKKFFLINFLILTLMLTSCSKNKITYKEDSGHAYLNESTYKFIGESEHFYFETGKVYYNENERGLLISNFNLKDSIGKNVKYLVNLYFNNKLLYGNEYKSITLTEKEYKNIVIEEHGYLGKKDQNGNIIGESDSFLETQQDKFKSSIRIEVNYCIKNNCKTETLKIKYIDG